MVQQLMNSLYGDVVIAGLQDLKDFVFVFILPEDISSHSKV